jgi:hypothetical protein
MIPSSFVSPIKGIAGRVQTWLANSRGFARLRRRIMAHLPFPVLESDVHDIVYANWVVPVRALAGVIPPGVEIVEADGSTILAVLTYAHGHFGPALAGPLRRLFPSPLQSNWRLYVRSIDGKACAVPTVLFLANIFDSALYAVGTRMFSDVMLAHHAARFEHHRTGEGSVSRASGPGSAPAWEICGREATAVILPAAFKPFFPDHQAAVRWLCLQDAAIARVEGTNALARSDIDLPIDIASAEPLVAATGDPGPSLSALGATGASFCFRIPAVRFRVLSESLMRRGLKDQARATASMLKPSGSSTKAA